MIRARRAALTAAILWLALLGVASPVLAAPKQKIAVLGLEVQTTTVDPQDTQVAQAFTRELRMRAKDPTGVYTLAPGSERELIDEKLMNECTSDSSQCLAKIGGGLGADQVLWGKVEKAGGDYRVTLKILNVNSKTVDVWGPKPIPAKAARSGSALGELARNGYDTLTGANTGGTLVIKSNAQSGKVWINDEEKGQLSGGTLTVSLPENRYKITIESDGFRKWESDTVTIRGGQTATIDAELVNLELGHVRGGTVSESSSNTGYKVAAGVSLGLSAVAAGALIYYANEVSRYDKGKEGEGPGDDQCGNSGQRDANAAFDHACSSKTNTWIAGVTTGVAAAAGIVFIYLAVRDSGEQAPSTGTAVRRTKKKPAFAVTPIISPEGGGATVRFDW